MTAVPSNPKFKHTVFISISQGYNKFKEGCALRSTTPSIDLRSSIGDSQSPIQHFGEEFSTSPFGSGFSSVDRAFGQDATRFGGGPANSQYSPFQQHGPWSFGAGPAIGGGSASNFSFSVLNHLLLLEEMRRINHNLTELQFVHFLIKIFSLQMRILFHFN